ncbi:target of rapamycin complex 2 subunit MAPKAP1-like [Ruditapes philippinarum]|uniref:target of rapamycin complex 2 subunit MAPKAP1-like n=1 Tax=Ruditapes philippinarum TaxID=129788 RepID=UPI00295B95A2|nr:target of rapamycin complex 2 subunit MAPKAP1-like [Ruditapes philippinarum]
MAMMDNKEFLISHIRNSFITSDDTGMCEMIIDVDDQEHRGGFASDSGLESSDNELSHSYDILPDMDYGAHRRRSNTAQRLERMKKEKRNQSKVKNISWKDNNLKYNAEEKGHLFEKKVVIPSEQPDTPLISRLSEQLDSSASLGENPFLEFAKFDGKASVGVSTKKIDIFLTMVPPEDRPYPMTVVVIATAKIQDLIGLICWQYTIEMREPPLQENIDVYCLHIAEDDGEVDTDFPSLDSKEPVSKFGFTKLALVQKDVPTSSNKPSIIVTVNVPHRGFNKFQIDSLNISMRDILEKVLKRRKIKVRPGQSYNLEKQVEPGLPVDLDANLSSMDTLEFCLVREHSSRGDYIEVDDGKTSNLAESLTSHQYKSYIVNMIHKIRTKTEVQLGISGEKVEIDPVASKSGTKLFRQKPVTYEADSIASCDMIEEKDGGKSVFRLTYFGHDYKHHDFEGDSEMCKEIVHKMNNILELRLSPVRKDYVAQRDKKLKKRESFHKT